MAQSSLQYALGLINNKYKHILEFGVYKGNTLRTIRQSLDLSFSVFGFDSFTGLPAPWIDKDNKIVVNAGHFSQNGKVPKIDNVQFYVGWFSDTLPEYLRIAQPIALLHIDCDLYISTKEVLWKLNKYIVQDTIIVFDEWFYRHNQKYNDHEQRAFYEWVAEFNRNYEEISFTDKTPAGEERKIIKII